MKTLLLFSLLASVSARADFGPMPAELPTGYECNVPANPERGLPVGVTIKLKGPDAEGAMAVTSANGQERALGFVSKIQTIARSHDEHSGPFGAIIGLIHEEDVSGVKPADLDKLTSAKVYEIDHPLTEVKLFRLFAGEKQLRGTLFMGGMATRCLPTK